LRRSKIVESVRGPGGGYYLAKPADKITIAEIIVAVDEPMDATKCGGLGNCHDEGQCLTHDLWTGLNAKIFEYLASVTLQQVVESQAGTVPAIVPVKISRKNAKSATASV